MTTAMSTGSITKVQSFHQYPSVRGTSYPFGSSNSAGNLIVVWVGGKTVAGGTFSLTVTDTHGNSYSSLSAASSGANLDSYSQIWYCYNCLAGANSIIITNDYFGDVGFQATEYSGIKSTSDPLDVAMTPMCALGNNTTSLTSNSFSPQSGSLIFIGLMSENVNFGTTTANDGITIFQYDSGHWDWEGNNLSSTAGTQTFTLSFTNSMGNTKYYALVAACFLAASTSSPTPPKLLIKY